MLDAVKIYATYNVTHGIVTHTLANPDWGHGVATRTCKADATFKMHAVSYKSFDHSSIMFLAKPRCEVRVA